jgi:hypothetical protein
MIIRCPDCGFTMSTAHGCGFCGVPAEEDERPAPEIQKEEPKESKTMAITGQSGLLFGSDCI